jgi:macrolide transport system ATP-binding/permease protein
MDHLLQDLRFGMRQLYKSPGFTLAAVLCIALGIGANAATFSFANAFLWRKSMASEPDRLVRLYASWTNGLKYGSFSFLDYLDVRDRNDVFTGLAVSSIMPCHLSSGDRNERVWGAVVSGNYFSVLGLSPARGRFFEPGEDRTEGTHAVVVLGHGFWKRRFSGDPGIIGRTLMLNRIPFTVVGVAPEGFEGMDTGLGQDLWIPIMMTVRMGEERRSLTARGNHWISSTIGRLKPGVTMAQARASVNALMAHLAEQYPDSNKGKSVMLDSESDTSLHPMVRGGFVMFLQLMFGVMGFILLLACANVAGLLLARSAARRKEIGLRMALGANRTRLVRQLLAESLLLSLLAGAAGLLLNVWLTGLIQSFRPPSDLPLRIDVSMNWPVLTFACAVTVLTGVLFGLTPALASTRADLVSVLKEGSPVQLTGASRLRRALVVAQVALSLGLLIGAGLVVRSLQNARELDPGFNPDNQVVASLELGMQQYDEAKGRQFMRSLRERLTNVPGVQAVGFSDQIPLSLSSSQTSVQPEGYTPPPGSIDPSIDYGTVDFGYFDAMGVSILRGRGFRETDTATALPVMVINETFAQRFWPGQDPIGKHVRRSTKDYLVIGVARNGKYFSLGEDPKSFLYLPMEQIYRASFILHVRTAVDPGGFLETVRKEVQGLDDKLPVSDLRTMHAAMGFALLPARLAAGVVSAFAFLALFLAAIGLYGVIAYSVSQSARDIGIRMALGARAGDVLRLVIRGGMTLTAIGLALGLGLGIALAQLMRGLLLGVSPADPLSYAAAIAVLAATAFLAVYVPARRATKVDPMIALRQV